MIGFVRSPLCLDFLEEIATLLRQLVVERSNICVCVCPHPRNHGFSFEIFLLCERSGKAASASG